MMSLGGESNSRLLPYHGSVLPLNYLGEKLECLCRKIRLVIFCFRKIYKYYSVLVGRDGFEPPKSEDA